MTMLIVVDDAAVPADLIGSSRRLANAAGWEMRGVHVHAPGGPELADDAADGLEVVELEGDPAAAISQLVEGAHVDAVAVGLPAQKAGRPGPLAESLLARLSAPLLLVRPGMRPVAGLRRLLVPLEGSPSGSAAMRHADDALCKRGREIIMLHVVTGSTPREEGSFPAPRIVDQEHYEWSAWQEEFCMRFSQCPEGGRHRVCVRVGEPAPTIVKESEALGAELIVLSWNGTFEGGHGAVVKTLMKTAPCPLLIVPAG
jgi:nucleotide-binding universal stress UspA family protein